MPKRQVTQFKTAEMVLRVGVGVQFLWRLQLCPWLLPFRFVDEPTNDRKCIYTRASSGTVSHLNWKIYKRIEEWRNRSIGGKYPYLYLDGIVLKRTWAVLTINFNEGSREGSESE